MAAGRKSAVKQLAPPKEVLEGLDTALSAEPSGALGFMIGLNLNPEAAAAANALRDAAQHNAEAARHNAEAARARSAIPAEERTKQEKEKTARVLAVKDAEAKQKEEDRKHALALKEADHKHSIALEEARAARIRIGARRTIPSVVSLIVALLLKSTSVTGAALVVATGVAVSLLWFSIGKRESAHTDPNKALPAKKD